MTPSGGGPLQRVRALISASRGNALRAQLLRGGAGSFVVKGLQLVLLFALSVILARTLGAEGYGVYAYAYAIVQLLGIPAQLGLQALVVREIAAYREQGAWGRLQGVLRFGFGAILASTAVLVTGAALVIWLVRDDWSPLQTRTLAWGLVLLPLVALGNFRGAALRGLKKVVQGLLPENVLQPGGFLLLVLGASLLASGSWLTADRAMLLHAAAATVSFIVGTWLLWKGLPDDARGAPPRYETRRWIRSAIPLSMIAGMQIVNSRADIVMLGIFGSPSDVGVYRVAVDGGLLVAFGLRAVNMVVAPHFSSLWTNKDRERLQRLATSSARTALGFALPVAAILMLYGDGILAMVFGSEFAAGHLALAIICIGQLINAAFGSVVVLLNMTGNETVVVRGMIVAASSNVILNLVMIPIWNIEGAAAATAITFGIWNLTLRRAARDRLSIDTAAIRVARHTAS